MKRQQTASKALYERLQVRVRVRVRVRVSVEVRFRVIYLIKYWDEKTTDCFQSPLRKSSGTAL
jgi:hypothetical protein